VLGWLLRTHTQHLLDEITWLRAELRSEHDRNAALQGALLTLKLERPVSALTSSLPREDTTVATSAEVERAARLVDDLGVGAVSVS
jgi:hypothetical protein